MHPALFRCPRCGHVELPVNPLARTRLEESGLCQGCRAARTLSRRPWLTADFVGVWQRVGFPASDSWLRDIPAEGSAHAPFLRTTVAVRSRGSELAH